MALILPRAALAPRLAHPDSATASHLAASHHLHGCWPANSPRCGSRRSPKRAMLTRRSTRWPTSSPASRDARQIDLAIDLQFSSDSTFVRAFRRQFGCTPGEIREMSEVWLRDTGTEPGPDDLLNQIGRR
jgi:AraC-like DNA-binding protein